MLITGVAFSLIGCGKNTADDTEKNTQDTVVDTTAPAETIKQRYIFTNDITKITDYTSIVEPKEEVTVKFIRFEKKDVLGKMDELTLKNLSKDAAHLSEEAALKIGSEEIPTQPGIYRSVFEIKDTSGNAAYEEIFIILDKDGATINDAEDIVVTVSKDKLSEKPEINTTVYKGYDEVDGTLTHDKLNYELTLMDETKHEWKFTISYTDRAENYTEEFYKVTVVEEKKQTSANNNSNTENTNNSGNTGNNNSGNTGSNNTGNSGNTNNNAGNVSDIAPNVGKYDPADTNKVGWVDEGEEMGYITPQKKKCIDAGYGVVVEQDGGEWYAVLTKDPDQLFNGKRGWELLDDYLKEHGLHAGSTVGSWISPTNEWYWFVAKEITEIEDGGMGEIDWDDIEWEDSY